MGTIAKGGRTVHVRYHFTDFRAAGGTGTAGLMITANASVPQKWPASAAATQGAGLAPEPVRRGGTPHHLSSVPATPQLRWRIERYGKRYGWIGFHIMAGLLSDRGQPPEGLEVDIDPAFPQPPQPVP